MDYLNHLYEFVDGTIDSSSEQQLFYELANNEELRTELKQQIAVTNAVRTDFRAFNPSAESTIRIFSELGMSSALAGTMATTATIATKGKLLTLLGKYGQGLFSFLVTASLALIAYFMLDFGNSSNNGNFTNSSNSLNNNNQFNSQNVNIPISSSYSKDKIQNDTTVKTEIIYKDRIIYKNEDSYVANLKSNYNKKINDLNNIIANLKSENQEKIEVITEEIKSEVKIEAQKEYQTAYQTLYLAQELPKVKERIVYEREFIQTESYKSASINLNEPLSQFRNGLESVIGSNLGFSFETSWAQYFSEYNEAVNPAQYQDFNNFRIGFLYDLNNEFSIGLDYRRENFYQIYNYVDNNGDPFKYEQKPNFNTINGALRYNPRYLELDNFSPFVQLGFGGNEGGTVGRFMLGTEYKITDNYKFIVAGDFNMLNFKNNNIQYNSNKFGLHMGIGFDF